VEDLIHFSHIDINDQQLEVSEKPPIVVSNPPYGERLQSEQGLAALYTNLGNYLRKVQDGRLYLISSSPDLYHRLRLKRIFKKAVKNGPLDCVIAGFEFNTGQAVESSKPVRVSETVDQSTQPLINRLKKNSKHIQRWAKRNNVSCFRVYDADLPEFAFALDVYRSDVTPDLCWYHLQEYQAPKTIDAEIAEQRIELAKQAVLQTFDIDESVLYCKTRQRQRGKKQYQKQDHQGELFQVREGDAALLINLTDYLDSGLFLDHRSTRDRVKNMAAGKSLLNLFCYTGSVGVQAMLGGADTVVNVDMSANYLKWAQENHDINDFKAGDRLAFIRADIVELLQHPERFDIDRQFDIIFLDPPSFSNSSKMQESLDIQRDHEVLITDAMKLLNRRGVLIFSTNRRGFKLSDSLSANMIIKDISHDTLPEDFKRRPQIHKCWEIRHRA
ncbi:MAG: bifunctional 23S rRNA (guanine(2069)-N(7))-methyltransferase RlmK/23S rRNA (guanine(2445)-N(2))-methyltransferase RlmL, partial [Gammaproteobacteria bacterium]|nr:bifunctional 23S rRNA (guanine(2069)-N(7))-methyltransferase RlmK/23S rRNA (guanine(2445)-N(2))-methyltransferase RlmL [Gammaproteobacteria bacterium]